MKYHYLAFISLTGLFFLVLMFLWAPNSSIIDKKLILSIFILICVLGMGAALYPLTCLKILKTSPEAEKIETFPEPLKIETSPHVRGHHLDCGEFDSHTFTFYNRKYCAGCSGLFLGALLAVLICITYYIYGDLGPYVFWIGVLLVFLALLQFIAINIKNNMAKLVFNLSLVVGSSLILVGILSVPKNLFVEGFFLILAVFWIITRISFSEKNHEKICLECRNNASCTYFTKIKES